MRKKSGFTLIELLAIIVILAIIAVITVPIILNIIDEARRGAAIDSAYGFKDAVQKYYLGMIIDDTSEQLPTGLYDITDLPSDFDVSGDHPGYGWLKLQKGKVIAYSLLFGDYSVTMYENENPFAKKNGGLELPFSRGIKVGNVQYYVGGDGTTADDSDNIVYFDPTSDTGVCTNYDSSNSSTGYKGTGATGNQTTCLRWYVYSMDDNGTEEGSDDIVNMILDHNTSLEIKWYAPNLYNYYGPTTAASQLATDTSSWTSNKLLVPSSYTASWDYDSNGNNTIDSGEHRTYTTTYSTKAKFIEADEVARIVGNSSWTYSNASSSSLSQLPSYLYTDLVSYDIIHGNQAYWTSSPAISYNSSAWSVTANAALNNYFQVDCQVSFTTNCYVGIRPVISVLKSNIL